ncbi:MAG: nucleotide exchange factor GrpE [Phycisphaerales bacterium]|nr:nucleotide exchange factor GrpE [Phycisphaerales bacterium]MCB9855332.1 nucleotide exchange factor GrpE [Phycisphaerales bacterium]MCB9862925.1 nucleotide exchange factor GrpE [Phycisphaerales bacterium]
MLSFLKWRKRKRSDRPPLPSRVIFSSSNGDNDNEHCDIEADMADESTVASDSNGQPLALNSHEAIDTFATRIADLVIAAVDDRATATNVVQESIQRFRVEFDDRIADLGRQISKTIADGIDARGRHVDGLIGRSLKPIADRVARALVKDADPHWTAIHKDLSDGTIRAAQDSAVNPIIEQQIVMLDRVRDERAFLASAFHKDTHLTLDVGARQFFEQYDAALASVVTEILMNIRGFGVEQAHGKAGPFDPKSQRVVGTDESTRPDLDGHVARVVRPGFSRNGTQIRPELVIVYRNGEARS